MDQAFYRIRTAYARDFKFSPDGWFTHVSIGAGIDVNVTDWSITNFKTINGGTDTATSTSRTRTSGSEAAPGSSSGCTTTPPTSR